MTDGEHHILAISEAIPGKMHDKKLRDQLQTLERVPDGCEVKADSGYQGLAKQAGPSNHSEPPTAEVQMAERPPDEPQTASRVFVTTPYKKPKGGALTAEQKAYNRALSQVRMRLNTASAGSRTGRSSPHASAAHTAFIRRSSGPSAASLTPKHRAGKRLIVHKLY